MADQKKTSIQIPDQDGLNELLLESVLTNSTDAIVITDPENLILQWNRSAETLFGYSAEAVLGKSIELILSVSTLQELRTTKKPEHEIEGKSADGIPIPMLVKYGDSVDSDKNLVAVTYIFHGLRERIKQEESIKQKIRALEAFSYSVSHDLRAPLRRIINYAEILEEDHLASLNEEVQRLISRMSKNAQKMSALIDDLLTFSRVGQQTVQKIRVNMDALVRNVVEEHRSNPDVTRAAITIERLESSEGDPTLLKQVFENLLSNAIKYSAPKQDPSILVGCIAGKDETTYFVKDNGVGFDMQYSQKLFNVFQRLHNPSDFEGTGIGLAIVQQIVSRHGGTVRAEGKVDGGAAFYFSLPK